MNRGDSNIKALLPWKNENSSRQVLKTMESCLRQRDDYFIFKNRADLQEQFEIDGASIPHVQQTSEHYLLRCTKPQRLNFHWAAVLTCTLPINLYLNAAPRTIYQERETEVKNATTINANKFITIPLLLVPY